MVFSLAFWLAVDGPLAARQSASLAADERRPCRFRLTVPLCSSGAAMSCKSPESLHLIPLMMPTDGNAILLLDAPLPRRLTMAARI